MKRSIFILLIAILFINNTPSQRKYFDNFGKFFTAFIKHEIKIPRIEEHLKKGEFETTEEYEKRITKDFDNEEEIIIIQEPTFYNEYNTCLGSTAGVPFWFMKFEADSSRFNIYFPLSYMGIKETINRFRAKCHDFKFRFTLSPLLQLHHGYENPHIKEEHDRKYAMISYKSISRDIAKKINRRKCKLKIRLKIKYAKQLVGYRADRDSWEVEIELLNIDILNKDSVSIYNLHK